MVGNPILLLVKAVNLILNNTRTRIIKDTFQKVKVIVLGKRIFRLATIRNRKKALIFDTVRNKDFKIDTRGNRATF